ncbi:MAG: helix-turn-helix domain-containing protein, partial [Patescibacteria group bacterium]
MSYASQLSGYHRERIRQFIREGKLPAEKIGTVWYVAENIFSEFLKKVLNKNRVQEKTFKEINSEIILQKFGELNDNLHKLDDRLSKFESEFASDPWDRLLLGKDNSHLPRRSSGPQKSSGFYSFSISKQSAVKVLAVLLIVSAAGFFILKNPESIYANFKDFRNFSNQVSVQASGLKNSLQTSAVLAAVSFQKAAVSTAADIQKTAVGFKQTALNFPNQALNLAKQTLNQARS